MSRHRAVRNLDIDEVLEEDAYSDDYDENEFDENELSNEDLDALEDGLAYVRSVVGDDCPVPDIEIKEALWYYYFDREETVNWVLEKASKLKAEKEKQKKKAAAKAAKDVSIDRKAHYRRPPSVMYCERKYSVLDNPATPSLSPQLGSKSAQQKNVSSQTASKSPSLSQLASKTTQTTSPSLSQLASKSKQPSKLLSGLATKTEKPPTSLQGLANSALKSGKGPSSLQSLANSTLKSNNGPTSLQSLAKKSTANSSNVMSLKSLASRQQSTTTAAQKNGTTSLAALAQKSAPAKGPTSLAHLASRSQPPPPPEATEKLKEDGKISTPVLSGEAAEQQKPKVEPVQKPAKTSVDSKQIEATTSNVSSRSATKEADPLCAPPSAAAQFLFKSMGSDTTPLPAVSKAFSESLAFSVGSAFFESIKASAKNLKVFAFDVPSPDDIVQAAQSNRNGGGSHSHTKS